MIPSGFALAHVRRRRSHRAVVPLEMDADDLVPFLFAHVEDHPVAQDAGNVDQDVELPEFLDRMINESLAAGHRRDILSVCSRAPTHGFDLVHHLIGRSGRLFLAVNRHAEVIDNNCRAFCSQQFRDPTTDSTPASGDRCNFAVEFAHRDSPVAQRKDELLVS